MNIDAIMRAAPVIPVLILEEEMDWAALAETFKVLGDTTKACGEVVFALRRCLSPGGRRIVCR